MWLDVTALTHENTSVFNAIIILKSRTDSMPTHPHARGDLDEEEINVINV